MDFMSDSRTVRCTVGAAALLWRKLARRVFKLLVCRALKEVQIAGTG